MLRRRRRSDRNKIRVEKGGSNLSVVEALGLAFLLAGRGDSSLIWGVKKAEEVRGQGRSPTGIVFLRAAELVWEASRGNELWWLGRDGLWDDEIDSDEESVFK